MGAPEENSESLHQSSINTAIFALTTMSSLSGNSVVCLAFYRNRRLRTITNFYILSLALADMMVAVFVFPFGTIAYGLGTWPFSHNYCQFTGFLSLFWAEVSLCIMALTSINRYLCVVKPRMYRVLFTKRNTISSILWFWICSFNHVPCLQCPRICYLSVATLRFILPTKDPWWAVWEDFEHNVCGFDFAINVTSDIWLQSGLQRCQKTQQCHLSFTGISKQPKNHKCARDKNISRTFCCCVCIFHLLDSFYSRFDFRIWFSGKNSFFYRVHPPVVLYFLRLHQPSDIWRHEPRHAKGVS